MGVGEDLFEHEASNNLVGCVLDRDDADEVAVGGGGVQRDGVSVVVSDVVVRATFAEKQAVLIDLNFRLVVHHEREDALSGRDLCIDALEAGDCRGADFVDRHHFCATTVVGGGQVV